MLQNQKQCNTACNATTRKAIVLTFTAMSKLNGTRQNNSYSHKRRRVLRLPSKQTFQILIFILSPPLAASLRAVGKKCQPARLSGSVDQPIACRCNQHIQYWVAASLLARFVPTCSEPDVRYYSRVKTTDQLNIIDSRRSVVTEDECVATDRQQNEDQRIPHISSYQPSIVNMSLSCSLHRF